jgi:hypothetical protein
MSRCAQHGQAMTEFVVLALVLVPLLLILPLIGKYVDMMQAAEAASRYVAFEGVARNSSNGWKDDTQLAAEVRRRFFSTSDAPVKTGDVAGDFAAHRNPVWSDAAGHPLIERFVDSVGVRTQVSGLNPLASAVFAGALGLSRDNLYTGAVTVRPANVPRLAPFDAIGLAITRRTVLLTDAWTLRDNADVRRRIESAGPMVPIERMRALVGVAGQLPTLVFDPPLRVGDFDWDIVPCDRLIGGC